MYTSLTIAGTDPSGGAGQQADLKTMTAHKVYAMSVITSIVVQNTMGVRAVYDLEPTIVSEELDAVFSDIFPDAVKIGMVSSVPLIEVIAQALEQYRPKNIVLDTVMVSTSGHRLLKEDAEQCLIKRLIPLADIITPNIPEAEVLAGMSIHTKDEMIKAAQAISSYFPGYILIKGGHLVDCSDDLLFGNGEQHWLTSQRVATNNTHGTGCTLSSAIASNLAKGCSMLDAVSKAKGYIYDALAAGLDLGHGNGPVDHCCRIPE